MRKPRKTMSAAHRVRHLVPLQCDHCHLVGQATASEDREPVAGNWKFRFESLPIGFVQTRFSDVRAENEISCVLCWRRVW